MCSLYCPLIVFTDMRNISALPVQTSCSLTEVGQTSKGDSKGHWFRVLEIWVLIVILFLTSLWNSSLLHPPNLSCFAYKTSVPSIHSFYNKMQILSKLSWSEATDKNHQITQINHILPNLILYITPNSEINPSHNLIKFPWVQRLNTKLT